MNKIKRIINCIIPMTMCNFKCKYCYLSQTNSFKSTIPKLKYNINEMQKALTKERLGGTCMINMCAVGETLMAPYIVDFAKAMLENGHYVTIVTNGVLKEKINEFCNFNNEFKNRLFIKFSYHFLELKRLQLSNIFFDNINNIKKSGISYTIELTANDDTIPFIKEIKKECSNKVGALPHIIESRNNNDGFKKLTNLDNSKHMKYWNEFKTPLIKFQNKYWGKKRKEFCYAGDWILTLYLETGNISPCFAGGNCFQNIFEDVDKPIHFCAIGNKCPWSHCYAAYVLLTLGAIPELETIKYAQIRNRKNHDGKEWLRPEMKYFMSSKFIDSNKEYSKEKKNITNWYRCIEQNMKYDEKEFANSLKLMLNAHNLKSIAIYDDNNNLKYINSLIFALQKTNIKIKFIYSANFKNEKNKIVNFSKHKLKYIYKTIIRHEKIPKLYFYDKIPKVNALIITNVYDFECVKNKISEISKIKTLLITDLEME